MPDAEPSVPDYAPPVARLLELGELKDHEFTLDYLALGMGAKHVPELVRMAGDERLHQGPPESSVVWAPVHAWRALAQLGAEAAVEPLLELLARFTELDDDWVQAEVPQVLARLGAPALGPTAAFLADLARPEWPRIYATDALAALGARHPGLRAECVSRLARQLEEFPQQSEILNAFLAGALLELRAVDALPVLARAFASGRVDEAVSGDFEDVEIELGLKTERLHPRRPNRLTEWGRALREGMEAAPEAAPAGGAAAAPVMRPPKVEDAPVSWTRKGRSAWGS